MELSLTRLSFLVDHVIQLALLVQENIHLNARNAHQDSTYTNKPVSKAVLMDFLLTWLINPALLVLHSAHIVR